MRERLNQVLLHYWGYDSTYNLTVSQNGYDVHVPNSQYTPKAL
jgi:hypothetical protein